MIKKNYVEIIVNEDRCTGCIICQLWCSYVNKKQFNPYEANIIIENRYGLSPKISFLESCLHCGQCAEHCLYGALEYKEVVD